MRLITLRDARIPAGFPLKDFIGRMANKSGVYPGCTCRKKDGGKIAFQGEWQTAAVGRFPHSGGLLLYDMPLFNTYGVLKYFFYIINQWMQLSAMQHID